MRDEIKELVDNGIDPNKHKQAQKICSRHNQDTTFESVAREWHGKGAWVPGHAKRIIQSLEKNVFPIIGYKDISNIEAIDVTLVLSEIENRGAYDTAKRTCQRCVAIFDYAIFKGISDNNPAIGRSKFIRVPKTKHRPHLQADQIPGFLEALNNYSGRDYIKLALKLLFLTFVRPGELRCATWNEIDWKNRLWRIPAERMKMKRDHVIPLSNQTISALEKLSNITGNSDYLFPGIHNIHQPMSDVTLLKALKKMVVQYYEDELINDSYHLDTESLHDLIHEIRSLSNSGMISEGKDYIDDLTHRLNYLYEREEEVDIHNEYDVWREEKITRAEEEEHIISMYNTLLQNK